jgi:hypothetical protein
LILLLIAKSVLGADLNQKAETFTGVIFWVGIGLLTKRGTSDRH